MDEKRSRTPQLNSVYAKETGFQSNISPTPLTGDRFSAVRRHWFTILH